jgi:hypothetical protein
MARPVGRRNAKSYLAVAELERLKINPFEELMKCLAEIDDVVKKNIESYEKMRGYSDKSDAGSQYLSNALRGLNDKASIYMNLSKFKYPTLSAVAIKDYSDDDSPLKPVNTEEAIKIIKSDPFNIKNEDIVNSMKEIRNIEFLPEGNKK